ncbi:MAG: hypothetical protein DI576_01425 [Actinomyces sp.]|nr:MAG: hypothetical protein DI576_01425 [Actinomyces sp.]
MHKCEQRRPRAEIGSVPRRDRFSSAPRSVQFRAEIGSGRPPGRRAVHRESDHLTQFSDDQWLVVR